jgi:hypothetical protein
MRSLFTLVFAIMAFGCGRDSKNSDPAPAPEPTNSSIGAGIIDIPYQKNLPNSLVVCKLKQSTDEKCKLEATTVTLAENPNKELRKYKVNYNFNCRFRSSNKSYDSTLKLKAQPDEEGLVFAPLFMNKKDSIIISGTSDLRVEAKQDFPFGDQFEKGCYLTVDFELFSN